MPDGPPDIKEITFDRSVWHPLDHRVGSPRCVAFQFTKWQSIRTHLDYAWNYQWRGELRRLTLCRVGVHDRTRWWRQKPTPKTGVSCRCCGKDFEDDGRDY